MTRLSTPLDDCVVHSGVLFKRGYGKILGRKPWKPRHFELTRTKLRYYKFENGKLRGEIDLMQCSEAMLDIMPADAKKTGHSAASIWRLALNVPRGPRLLIAAPTEREMNEWIMHFSRVLRQIDAIKTMQRDEANPGALKPEDWERFVPGRSKKRYVDRVAEPALDSARTDFQNFVALPRRSVIFRRHSIESRPVTIGAHRHSTGQIDLQLQKELEEIRSGNFDFGCDEEQKNDDDDEDEEALERAVRDFSLVRSENNKEMIADADVKLNEGDGDVPMLNSATTSPPITGAQPIFYYKKEDPPSDEVISIATNRSSTSEDERTWFSRFSGKIHRMTRKTIDMRDARAEELPDHFREDPAVAKPRRFSTGSMLFNSQANVAVEPPSDDDREEALIQELLTGRAPSTEERNVLPSTDDPRMAWCSSSPRHPALGVAATNHKTGLSEPRTSTTASNDQISTPRQSEDIVAQKKPAWFRRLTGRWRTDSEANEGNRPTVPDSSGSATSRDDRPGYFRRLGSKLQDGRGKQSRRYSTGDMLPEVCEFISEEQPTDELQFTTNYRRGEVCSGRFLGYSRPARVCAA